MTETEKSHTHTRLGPTRNPTDWIPAKLRARTNQELLKIRRLLLAIQRYTHFGWRGVTGSQPS